MLRRAFCRVLGAVGLGGGIAAAMAVEDREFAGGVDMASGPDCAVTWGKDRQICVIRSGDKVSIFVMNGGTLNVGAGGKIDAVRIGKGGKADFSKADMITTVNDYRIEVGDYG